MSSFMLLQDLNEYLNLMCNTYRKQKFVIEIIAYLIQILQKLNFDLFDKIYNLMQ